MYSLQTLKNGLRLITAPMSGTKTATILLMVRTGSKYESKENNGISHFLEHMFFKGTKRRPNALAISSELDAVGGVYNAFTGKEYTGYWVKIDSGKIELAFDIVSDMLINSKFESAEIEREKGVIIEEINMYRDNPMFYVEDLFEQVLYGNTPAGWDVIGTKKNIEGFSRKVFTDYFQRQYGVASCTLGVAGSINQAKIIGLSEKYFKRLAKNRFKEKEKVRERQSVSMIKAHYKKTDQAHISLGVRSCYYGHDNYIPTVILAAILGSSMSSRLFIQLRERRGLAYYVRTNSELYTDSGYLTSQAGVPIPKIEEAISVIMAEYGKLKKEPVGAKELQRIKDLIRGRSVIALESSDNMANWYVRQAVIAASSNMLEDKEQLKKHILTPEEYFRKIDKITPKQLREVANEIFVPEKLNLAVIGPFKDSQKFTKLLKI